MKTSELIDHLKSFNPDSEILIGGIDESNTPYDAVSAPVIEIYQKRQTTKIILRGSNDNHKPSIVGYALIGAI